MIGGTLGKKGCGKKKLVRTKWRVTEAFSTIAIECRHTTPVAILSHQLLVKATSSRLRATRISLLRRRTWNRLQLVRKVGTSGEKDKNASKVERTV
jgi:hypothetical protein